MASNAPERTFLVVDDEPDILDAIERLFRKEYRVLTANSAAEALEIVQRESIQVVMSDQRMPSMSGIELLEELHKTHPDIVRVLFTGYSNIDHVIDAINQGHVYRYISKPWKPAELRLFVAQAFDYYVDRQERRSLIKQLQSANERMEKQLNLLSIANEELKTLDRVKNVFMEVVSHELNTPIAIILGYVFLLKKELDGARGDLTGKAIEGIDTSAMRLKNISNRIFKMLADEGPTSTLNLEWVTLKDLADELHTQISPFLQKRHQTFKVTLPSEPAQIHADPEKLSDIFLNLLMNAIKFSRDGQTITLSVEAATDEPETYVFSVQDQGIGISDEDVSQIFNSFFSTFESKHHSSGSFEFGKRGIGLGLSVARRFAEMHAGSIHVESVEGEGSRFVVRLPRDPEQIHGLVNDLALDTPKVLS
ncbi:hybrid sensor histidine kinase/response regulator [Bradymonas sediminis]|uniref:histidine kinase n=1 Tax=Bradymonas sediminis TaxID=1548548 RepID=A0A2Z4FH81_9DELT|nr:hybrid sensor histidine kinase/response regulator [Bradymonas sediminis]AWV88104.1 hybrid sensor histidine kinase/response regulator [Bradymonas sediminis]TDP77227.1 signal transduction histidine kinase [Bradymonas sediminis]